MSTIFDKDHVYDHRGILWFNKTVAEMAIFSEQEIAKIKEMNSTLACAVYGKYDYCHSNGDDEWKTLNDEPDYIESLRSAYELFKQFKEAIHANRLAKLDTSTVSCLLYKGRIIFKHCSEIFSGSIIKRVKLTYREYLQKYAQDAIFFFEQLNQRYIRETPITFLDPVSITLEPEPKDLEVYHAQYTIFFNDALKKVYESLLVPPLPPQELGLLGKAKEYIVSAMWGTSKISPCERLRQRYAFEELFDNLTGRNRFYKIPRTLDRIKQEYKRRLNEYASDTIKSEVLALGISRLFPDCYEAAIKNVTDIQRAFDQLKRYREYIDKDLIAPEISLNSSNDLRLAGVQEAPEEDDDDLRKRSIHSSTLKASKHSRPDEGGSKKYISRRKYKRTSTKTKRIRKLI